MKNKIIILIAILSILCSGCASSGKADVLKDTSDSAINTTVTEELVSEATVEEVSVAEVATTEEPTTEVVSTEKTESNAPRSEVIKVSLSENGEVIEIVTDASADDSISDDDEYLLFEQSDVPSRTIHSESYFDYEYGTVFNGYGVYELDDDITRGAVATSNLAESSPTVLDFEAYYGLTAYTSDFILNVKAYNHSKDHPIVASEIISDMGNNIPIEVTYDEYIIIDCSSFEEGLYAIHTTFDTMDMYLYFYVAENGVFTCRVNDNPIYETELLMFRMDDVQTAIEEAGMTPENCLSIDDIVYPCIESPGHRCDTARWAQLSHDLLGGHSEWSDEAKLFTYTEW
uniref:hypothetical protein n=1 Tax=Acetatifactor sp. TaxID=1872090 RepID=UPI0040573B99